MCHKRPVNSYQNFKNTRLANYLAEFGSLKLPIIPPGIIQVKTHKNRFKKI